jgi:hypothetical protein
MKWLKDFSGLWIVVVSVLLSVSVNYLLFTTDNQVWRKAAIQNIQAIGKLEEVQVNYRNEVAKLLQDLHNIRNIKQVDSILTKHGI